MRRRFGSLVIQAVYEQNPELAVETYERALSLPQTTTEQQLFTEGYNLNGPMLGNEDLIICYSGLKTNLLKVLTHSEKERGKAYLRGMEGATNRFVTTFELHSSNEKHFMIMPCFVSTLETVSALCHESSLKLWNQVSAGLDFMHSKGFVHMDVKPPNICLRENGDVVLIDLGSVVRLDEFSQCTVVYLPHDMQLLKSSSNKFKATMAIDWWMLAVVMAEKMFAIEIGGKKRHQHALC